MPYTSLDALTKKFGTDMLLGLTDRATPPAGVIDIDVVNDALTDTDAVIDGYLGTRYVLPLVETPPQIPEIAISIAIWKLHTFEPGDKIKSDYRDALQALRDIAKGAIKLNATTVEPATTGDGGARMTDRERPLTQENLKGFI